MIRPLLLAGCFFAAACGGGDSPERSIYGIADELEFVEVCSSGSAGFEDDCRCTFAKIRRQVPYEQYRSSYRDALLADDEEAWPDDVLGWRTDCILEAVDPDAEPPLGERE